MYSQRIGEQIRVTYTSVHPEEIEKALLANFDKNALLEKFKLPKDKFIVLAVGQFIDRKGRWTFLKAAETLAKTDADIAFVWLAPNLPGKKDQLLIDNLALGDSFHLILSETVGTNRQDILRFFAISDVFALPSFIEGLPIALLEAMALKRPSISTNVYGIPEAVQHLETGLLIEPGDSKALAEAILLLKNGPGLRKRLSENGSRYVLKHFDDREAAKIALAAYAECFSPAEPT